MSIHSKNFMPTDDQAVETLKHRAALLKRHVENRLDVNEVPYVSFKIGAERYFGVSFSYILEILNFRMITSVPNTPSFVAGVITHRGLFLPVVDVKKLMGIKDEGVKESAILVLSSQGIKFGLLIDNVNSSAFFYETEKSILPKTQENNFIYAVQGNKIAILNIDEMISHIKQLLQRAW